MEIVARNVIEALQDGVTLLSSRGIERPSRNGRMLEYPLPIYTHYSRPQERVLFAPARDANPFLHLFEALWMLQGREDLTFLKTFTKNFDKYADDGERMQGSYGYRWIHQFGFNQIERVIAILKEEPESRRAVITMWDPRQDLTDFYGSSDIPCNTHIYFKIRKDIHKATGELAWPRLYMTVNNRSNDMLWGAYGANAVHMSMLGEYIMGSLGLPHFYMIQQSDSMHVYLDGPGGELWERVKHAHARRQLWENPYAHPGLEQMPMFQGATKQAFDADLRNFFEGFDNKDLSNRQFKTPYFLGVVYPMWVSHKTRNIEFAKKIQAADWRKACVEWLERRVK